MKRILGQTLFVLAAGFGAVALTPACAENDSSIFIRHVMAPPQNRQSGECIYTPDENQAALLEGHLDVALRDNYSAVLLVGGQLMPRGDFTNTRAESNRTHLNGAVVKVTDAAGGVISEFTAIGTGFVNPGQTNSASFGLMSVTLIDAPTTDKLALEPGSEPKLVLANVKVFGKTLGGVDVESGEFQFPIRVCNGCLISFATGDDPATDGLDCAGGATTPGGGGAEIQGPCRLGQDEGVPCELCRSFNLACRGQQTR